VSGLTGFVSVNEALDQPGIDWPRQTTSPARPSTASGRSALSSGFRVWVVPGIPQYYGFGFKSYGPNSIRNPLRVRLPEGETRPACADLPRQPHARYHAIQNLMIQTRFGVGVGDRTNGTPRYVNNANWADGTAA
jgi:hypothetical protein